MKLVIAIFVQVEGNVSMCQNRDRWSDIIALFSRQKVRNDERVETMPVLRQENDNDVFKHKGRVCIQSQGVKELPVFVIRDWE
jgi:hypothetical protein